MEKKGKLDDAELFYLKTLGFLGDSEVLPSYFRRLFRLYLLQRKGETAMEILRLGIRYLPEHPPFRIQLGGYYFNQGIYYRAQQEYVQARRLDPGNIPLHHKLEKLLQDQSTIN